MNPIILITINDPQATESNYSGSKKGYNGLGISKKQIDSGLSKIEEDLNPKLGGDLDANDKKIINTKSIDLGYQGIRLQYFEDINNMTF